MVRIRKNNTCGILKSHVSTFHHIHAQRTNTSYRHCTALIHVVGLLTGMLEVYRLADVDSPCAFVRHSDFQVRHESRDGAARLMRCKANKGIFLLVVVGADWSPGSGCGELAGPTACVLRGCVGQQWLRHPHPAQCRPSPHGAPTLLDSPPYMNRNHALERPFSPCVALCKW
jgi:hypothetical protein